MASGKLGIKNGELVGNTSPAPPPGPEAEAMINDFLEQERHRNPPPSSVGSQWASQFRQQCIHFFGQIRINLTDDAPVGQQWASQFNEEGKAFYFSLFLVSLL